MFAGNSQGGNWSQVEDLGMSLPCQNQSFLPSSSLLSQTLLVSKLTVIRGGGYTHVASGCHAVYQSLSFPIQSLAWSSLVVQGRSAGLHHLWQSRGTNKTEHSFPDLIPKQPLTAQTQGWLALPHSNLTLQISQALSWVGGQMKHKVR